MLSINHAHLLTSFASTDSAIATDGDDAAEDIETPSKKFKEEPVEEPDGGMNGIESFFDNAMA